MQCEKCDTTMVEGEERDFNGRILCEDCYMDSLSPPRTCDPWAVHSAKTFSKEGFAPVQLSDLQKRILGILEETGGVEPAVLIQRLQIKPADLEREIAALRHMEKLRGEMMDGKKVVRLW